MKTGYLPRYLVWQSMQTTTPLKPLSYPLPATTLTGKQCYLILKPVLAAEGLSRSSVVPTFPGAVIHGPVKIGGLGIMILFCEQNLTQI